MSDEGQNTDDGGLEDELRREPIVFEPAIEHDLERAEERRDQHEAEEIEASCLLPQAQALCGRGRRLPQDHGDQRDCDQPDRAVDQKAPVPRQIVGQPAAEGRPDHGRHHDRDAEQREALGALLRREGIRKDRLRDRHHAAAAQALHDAEYQQRLEIPRKSAQHRACGEQRQADQEEALAAEQPREERAGRQDNSVGDQIGGHDPGRLVIAHPHAACDIGQSHVRDRGVEHLHESGDRDEDGDQPWAGTRAGLSCGPSGCISGGAQNLPHSRSKKDGVASIRTLGTTDMPGPSATSVGGLSRMILTGTRWTILT